MATNPSVIDRLGADLKFPINGSFEPISGIPLLLQDIQQLLLTSPGERVGRPTYGCTLNNQIWENIDVAASRGQASIYAALEKFEPRITVQNVISTINRNTDLVTFQIIFTVKNTDSVFNLVFPFRTNTDLSFG